MKIQRFPSSRFLAPVAAIALSLATPLTVRAQAASGSWLAAPDMLTGRYAPGIVSLPDGRVLVAGGHNGPEETTSAQVYNPATNTWATTGSLKRARNFPVAMLVDEDRDGTDETPILFGGFNSSYGSLNTAERYATTTRRVRGKWVTSTEFTTLPSTMRHARELFTATRLPSGKVLLVGGFKTFNWPAPDGTLRTAETYDPVTRQFTDTDSMTSQNTPHGRFGHDAILLPGEDNTPGRFVLVAGGRESFGDWPALNTAELYDTVTERFTAVPYPMHYRRDRVTLAQVGSRCLLVGGTGETPDGRLDPLDTEWFDPTAFSVDDEGVITFFRNPFTPGPRLEHGRMGHTLTMLSDGGFVVVGGWATVRNEWLGGIFRTNPGTTATAERFVVDATGEDGSFVAAPPARYDTHDHGAASLPNGRVLIVGGKQLPAGNDGPIYYPARAEVYVP
jgi:hypothetical protein